MIPLEANRLLRRLSSEEMAALNRVVEPRGVAAGQKVFGEGDEGDGIYFVLSGVIQISAVVGNGERRVLSRIQPGDFFGEMAVLDQGPRSATALAEEDAQLGFVPSAEMLDMLGRFPTLATSLVREFSLRLREFNRQYIQEVLQAERLTLVGRFARSIVHDFKNPLNIIGISAEMAAMEISTPAMRQSAKTRIRKQVDRLSNMINELLEFTRGTQTNMVLAETNYATYLVPLLDEIRTEVAVKNVSIEFESEPPDVSVLIDPGRLTHVFYNLIHNAVDAMMPDGGRIRVRCHAGDTEVRTEIEDSGKGIPAEIAPRLFEAFATYGKAQGTGLGLSICKRIITDHKGRIGAANGARGGAVFSFTLPRPRAA